jgi:hypothetical protein
VPKPPLYPCAPFEKQQARTAARWSNLALTSLSFPPFSPTSYRRTCYSFLISACLKKKRGQCHTVSQDETSRWSGFKGENLTWDMLSKGGEERIMEFSSSGAMISVLWRTSLVPYTCQPCLTNRASTSKRSARYLLLFVSSYGQKLTLLHNSESQASQGRPRRSLSPWCLPCFSFSWLFVSEILRPAFVTGIFIKRLSRLNSLVLFFHYDAHSVTLAAYSVTFVTSRFKEYYSLSYQISIWRVYVDALMG